MTSTSSGKSFERAIRSVQNLTMKKNKAAFTKAYDEALEVHNTAWNLTMGLYWIRPRNFPTLDEKSREYITETLGIPIPKDVPDAAGYLKIMDDLKDRFEKKGLSGSVHFPN